MAFAARRVIPSGWPIFSSAERKAIELAKIIAAVSGAEIVVEEAFGENDRSATGYLPPDRFEALVDRFFGDPARGPDGWESAEAAQQRIVTAAEAALRGAPARHAVFCGHGGVGTLLKCWAGNRAIARREDQREIAWRGGGNCFAFTLEPRGLLGDWVPMEDFTL
jgi:broad specificity phosphatase PhoE